MSYLEGCVGGTGCPRLIYTYHGTTTDWDDVPTPSVMVPKWLPAGDRIELVDGTEIDINRRFRLIWELTYVWLDRDDELAFQEASQSTLVLFFPHKDSGSVYEVQFMAPWMREWAAGKAVGHVNKFRLREVTLRNRISDIGEAYAASGGSSWGRP